MNARISNTQPPAEGSAAAPLPLLPLNEHTRMILGRPNFACKFTARRMRELGHKINFTAQDEQAAVLHLHLNMYQQHGADWFEHVNAYLERGPHAVKPPVDLVADTMHHAQLQALGQKLNGGS